MAGKFASLLRAQSTSPTLSLAHANIGDEGALEIAHFLSGSNHIVCLDLSGNNITSTGVLHLARATKQNLTLESLRLKHNRIGDSGETGLAALCRALHGNTSLRHLDLRHNNIEGALAADSLGVLLEHNAHLTHLELSWNPLNPAGGQVLLDRLKKNTTLFDCQLTGCKLAEETLIGIAQILMRNRKAKGADLQAGPYELQFERAARDTDHGRVIDSCTLRQMDRTLEPSTNAVPSAEVTNTMMVRLMHWMQAPSASPQDKAHAQELYDHLDVMQKKRAGESEATQKLRLHVEALASGFQDRELRHRRGIAAAKAELQEYAEERQGLLGIFDRYAEELRLQRETSAEAHRAREEDVKRWDADEARLRSDLNTSLCEKQEAAKRLQQLEEQSARLEKEHAKLRGRSERLREGVILLQAPG